MEILEILILLIIVVVVGAIFYYGFKRRGPWGTFWAFLLILFLAALAGRVWIEPAGPELWGYTWLPIVFWIFVVALIIGIAGDRNKDPDYRKNTQQEVAEDTTETAAAFGAFFWILLSLLLVTIILGLLL